jgi:hypothetical protein
MSANWIKWCKGLAHKREVLLIASRLQRDSYEIAGRLMALWEWCDDNMDDVHFVGEDAIMSLGDRDRVIEFIDGKTGLKGMAEALEKPDVNWLKIRRNLKVIFVKLRRHNGKTAKERATEQRKKARQRDSDADSGVPDYVPLLPGLDERKTRGEFQSSKGDRKTIGSASAKSGDNADTDRRQSSHSPKDMRGEEKAEPFDLSFVDWDRVVSIAESAAKRVPPRSAKDRRAWLKYAVLAEVTFSEDWMIDAAQAVVNSAETRRTKQAHFVGILKGKAEEDHGVSGGQFVGMFRRIEIPKRIWKLPILEVRK